MRKKQLRKLSMPLGVFFSLCVLIVACTRTQTPPRSGSIPVEEARSILVAFASYGGEPFNALEPAASFPDNASVFMKSIYGIEMKLKDPQTNPSGPICTLPLYKGLDSKGNVINYIITEASDPDVAKLLGISYSPRLVNAKGSSGVQIASIAAGIVKFAGTVDFSAKRLVVPGTNNPAPLTTFPPSSVTPGGNADGNWSDVVVMPSGVVLNCEAISNATGVHDRIPHYGTIGEDNQNNPYLDVYKRKVSLQILDGWQNGRRYFYHLVTSSSDPVPSSIELGYYCPKMAKLPTFGTYPAGCLLGFSPCSNGPDNGNQATSQGLNVGAKYGQELDPVNVFSLDPTANNYSPMWDAHISMWTQKAIDNGKRRIITGIDDLAGLVKSGDVVNFIGNNTAVVNDFIAGLSPTDALINCPVIAHPDASLIGMSFGTVLKPGSAK